MPEPTDAPLSQPQRLGLLAALVVLALLTLPTLSTSRLYVWPSRGLALLFWCAPIVLLLRYWWIHPPGWRTANERLLVAGAGLLALAAVAAALTSPYRPLSLPYVWPTLGGTALLLWLHAVLTDRPTCAELFAPILAGVGIALALGSLFLWLATTPNLQWAVRNTHPFGHSITTAGAMVLLLPWMALGVWRTRSVLRFVTGPGFLAGLVTLASTSSRGGVLALALAAVTAAVIALLRAPWSARQKSLVLLAVLGLALAGAFTNERLRELVLTGGWNSAARESNSQRTAMLTAGALLGQQRPLLGWGPGTVPIIYPTVRAQLRGGVDNVLQLHNTPLQIWATLGTAGALAVLLLGSAVLVTLPRRQWTPLTIAAATSLGGYLLFSLTDHQLDVPLINVVCAANLALLTTRLGATASNGGRSYVASPTLPAEPLNGEASCPLPAAPCSAGEAGPAGRSLRHAIPLLAIALLVLPPLPTTVRDTLARRAYASDDLTAAIGWMPADPYYRHQLSSHAFTARLGIADPVERQRLTDTAISALRDSLAGGAHTEYAHFNLGWLLLETDAPAEAEGHFRAAAGLAPTRGGVYFGLGLAQRALGRQQAATRSFALEALNDPSALSSPLWEMPALADEIPAVLAELQNLPASLSHRDAELQRAVRTRIAWVRWWQGYETPAAAGQRVAADLRAAVSASQEPAPVLGFSAASQAFLSALPEIEARRLVPPAAASYAWARLYHAWQSHNWDRLPGEPVLIEALQRRAQRHRQDFVAFLRSGTEADPVLARQLIRIRPGYGIVAFHPDGAPPNDVPTIQENRLLAHFGYELFPPKGELPASVLLRLLPAKL